MADLSQIKLGNVVYNLKDSDARARIDVIESTITKSMHYRGKALNSPTGTSDGEQGYAEVYVLVSGTTVNCWYHGTAPSGTSITIGGTAYTIDEKFKLQAGDTFVYGTAEYLFSDDSGKFNKLGDTSRFGAFAYADKGKATYTPSGTVAVTITPSKSAVSHSVTQGSVSASGSFTPAGTITVNPSKVGVVKNITTDTIAVEYTDINVGATPTTTTLTTDNVKGYTGNTKKYLSTTTITPAVAGSNVTGIRENTEVTASHLTAASYSASKVTTESTGFTVAAPATSATNVVTSATLQSTVVTGVTATGSVVTEVGSSTLNAVNASVTGELLTLSTVTPLASVTPTTANTSALISTSTGTQSKETGSVKGVSSTNVTIPKYTIASVDFKGVKNLTDVTASKVVSASAVSVPAIGNAVTVATGATDTTSTTNAAVITDISSADKTFVTGLASGTSVVTNVTSGGSHKVVTVKENGTKTIATGVRVTDTVDAVTSATATFAGTEGTVNVSGSTSGVAVANHTTVVTGVTGSATFTGTQATIVVNPVND